MNFDIKQIEKLLKLCRKQGVTEFKVEGIEFKLGDLPAENQSGASIALDEIPTENPYANFPSGIMTPSQLAFYSSGGDPADDPEMAIGEQ